MDSLLVSDISVQTTKVLTLTASEDTVKLPFGTFSNQYVFNLIGQHTGCGGSVELVKGAVVCRGCDLEISIPEDIERLTYGELSALLKLLRREPAHWLDGGPEDKACYVGLRREQIATFVKFWKELSPEERKVYVLNKIHGKNSGQIGEMLEADDVICYPGTNAPLYSGRVNQVLSRVQVKCWQYMVERGFFLSYKDEYKSISDYPSYVSVIDEGGIQLLMREIVFSTARVPGTPENRALIAACYLDVGRMEVLVHQWLTVHQDGREPIKVKPSLAPLTPSQVHRCEEKLGINFREMRRLVELWRLGRRPAVKGVKRNNHRLESLTAQEIEFFTGFWGKLSDSERLVYSSRKILQSGEVGELVGASDVKTYMAGGCIGKNCEPFPLYHSRQVQEVEARIELQMRLDFVNSPLFFLDRGRRGIEWGIESLVCNILFGGGTLIDHDEKVVLALYLDIPLIREVFSEWVARNRPDST